MKCIKNCYILYPEINYKMTKPSIRLFKIGITIRWGHWIEALSINNVIMACQITKRSNVSTTI